MKEDRLDIARLLEEISDDAMAREEPDLPGVQRLLKAYLDRGKQLTTKRQSKLLIERAKAYHQVVADVLLATQGFCIASLAAYQVVAAFEDAQEFFWKDSAWAMGEVIRRGLGVDGYALSMQDRDRWIAFEHAKETPCGMAAGMLLLWRSNRDTLRIAAKRCKLRDHELQRLDEIIKPRPDPQQWTVHVVGEDGASLWSCILEYSANIQKTRWVLTPFACPYSECHEEDDGVSVRLQLCPPCLKTLDFWLSWLSAATRMLNGEFRQTAEPEEPQYYTETEVRTERDPVQSWKRKEVKVQHKMRVVQFDASLAKSKPKTTRGSWTAGRDVGDASMIDLLDDNAVIYTNIEHGAHTRHFRHSRYKAARGTSRSFGATKAFTPVTVRYLKARRAQGEAKPLTVVTAKKFEGEVQP